MTYDPEGSGTNEHAPEPASTRDYRWLLRAIPIIGLVVLFVVFAAQNAEPVQLEFLGWEFETRRVLLLVGSAVFGILVWELAGFIRRRRRSRKDTG